MESQSDNNRRWLRSRIDQKHFYGSGLWVGVIQGLAVAGFVRRVSAVPPKCVCGYFNGVELEILGRQRQ